MGIKKYSNDAIALDASKYKTPKEWYSNSPSLYNLAHQRGLIEKVTSHMEREIRPKGYWTKNLIKEIVIKFNSFKEWIEKHPASYGAAHKLGLLKDNEIIGHLKKGFRKKGQIYVRYKEKKWSEKKILLEAKKFQTRKEWREKSSSSYSTALKLKLTDEASKHMERLGSIYKRCLYCIKIPSQNLAYVGLTYNYKERIAAHLKTERFKNLINLYGRKSLLIQKLTDYIDKEEAAKYEKVFIKSMEEMGWKILNKIAGGGLGGGQTKWIPKTILENIKKYSTYKDWAKNESGAYAAAIDMKLIDEIDKILPREKKFPYWNEARIKEEVKKYKTKTEFRKKSVGAYEAAKRFGIFDEITSQMPKYSGNRIDNLRKK